MKIIEITDYYGKIQEVPVDDALFEEWQELRRESDRLEKEMYYRDGTPLDTIGLFYAGDEGAYDRDLIKKETYERLYAAILELPPDQQRRIYMLLDDMNYADIARVEGRTHPAIRRSFLRAFKHLRMLLSD